MKICDLKEGTKIFNETFLINDVVKKTATNGTIFLSFIFQDNSGLINGIKWVVLPEETNLYKKNMAIIIRSGRVVNYNNRLQLTIEEMLPADEKSIDLNKFAIESPVPKEILVKEFLGFKNNIQIEENTTFNDIKDCFLIPNKTEIVKFAPKDKNYNEIIIEFINEFKKRERLSCFMITEDGSANHKIIGIITAWDIIGKKE